VGQVLPERRPAFQQQQRGTIVPFPTDLPSSTHGAIRVLADARTSERTWLQRTDQPS
jgi:hypothetical protein